MSPRARTCPTTRCTFTGTVNDINGVSRTGTWTIESRKQVREKTQLALDRGMPGMFSWTLHYDATNNLGLHRVMHHYIVVKRDVPDVNLDGNVNATDANTLANNMGTRARRKGTATAAQFDELLYQRQLGKGRPRRQRIRESTRRRLARRAVHRARRQFAGSPGLQRHVRGISEFQGTHRSVARRFATRARFAKPATTHSTLQII